MTAITLAGLGISLCVASLVMQLASTAPEPQPITAFIVVPAPTTRPTASPSQTPPGQPTASPDVTPSLAPLEERPTRLAIPALKIDLPVIVPPENEPFPACDVAEVETRYGTMQTDGVTYLYAHAREGMLWEVLVESRKSGGNSLIGMEVLVWTDALLLHRYALIEVHPHQETFRLPDRSDDGPDERLWLQTSETGHHTGTKLLVVAAPTTTEPATAAASLPNPQPRVCGS